MVPDVFHRFRNLDLSPLEIEIGDSSLNLEVSSQRHSTAFQALLAYLSLKTMRLLPYDKGSLLPGKGMLVGFYEASELCAEVRFQIFDNYIMLQQNLVIKVFLRISFPISLADNGHHWLSKYNYILSYYMIIE